VTPVPGKSTPSGEYAKCLALFEAVVATVPGVERKGDTMPYTSMNGNMFSLLTKDGTLVLRLGEADRAAFVKKFKTEPVVLYGAVMKEYVAVPDALLAKTKELAKYFQMSVEYAKSLKAKPTTRKKKQAGPKAGR
jgi:TfoX/Sxy family transcriptional regulator of competence genes